MVRGARVVLFAFALLGAPAPALTPAAAPTGSTTDRVPSPVADVSIADLQLLTSALVIDLDREVRKDVAGAFLGSHCDALMPLVESTLEQDPDRLLALYLAAVCAKAGGTLVEADSARARFVAAAARSELPSGEDFGDEVRKASTALDANAFALAMGYEILVDYFEIAGGGRRLHYVLVVRDPDDGRQRTLRFDTSAFTARLMNALAERLSPEARTLAEDSPAILFVQTILKLPVAAPSVRIGFARYLAKIPGYSLERKSVRDALAAAVADDGTYARLALGQSYLLDPGDTTAPAQAYAEFREASKAGLAEADVVLSVLYAKGIGVAKDPAESKRARERADHALGRARADALLADVLLATGSRLYDAPAGRAMREQAAREGDVRAQNSLGIDCESRPRTNLAECVDWYAKASAQGYAVATFNLAQAYEHGKGVAKDEARAAALYEKAAADGYLTADANLGWMLERDAQGAKDTQRITALYRTAAEWGDPWGENNYGNNLRDGNGVAKDPERAIRWLRLAAAQGNTNAAFTLADAYEMGRGVAPDQAEAVAFYRIAIAGDSTAAMIRLSIMAREGRGREKDDEVANGLLKRAAELGDSEAMWRLGIAEVYGNGIAADRAAGLDWLRRSVEKKNEHARINLAVALLGGDSERERAEGVERLRDLAQAGDAEGMNALGFAYENGLGVERSDTDAAAWYRKGADAGNATALSNFAQMQHAGRGVVKDAVQARASFEAASAAGAEDATCNLANMLISGEGGTRDAQRGYALRQQAADAHQGSCALDLGIAYRYGDVGIDADMDKARRYLKIAQDQHLDEATAQLADIAIVEHEDDEQQARAALAVLTRLADAHVARAALLLGEACLMGRLDPPDFACARRRFREAGEQGFRVAASTLGLMLEAGIGGPVDLADAETWFRKAIELGLDASRYELGRLLLHEGRASEGLENLVATASEGDRLPMYVVMRYCEAHRTCEVPAPQRAAFAKNLEEVPDDRKNAVAWGLATDAMSDAEDGRYAVKLMESLTRARAPTWAELDTLAAALARAGEFERAAATERRAIAAAAETSRGQRRSFEMRVSLYEAKKPWDLPF